MCNGLAGSVCENRERHFTSFIPTGPLIAAAIALLTAASVHAQFPDPPAQVRPFTPFAWHNLERRLAQEQQQGFWGAVIIVEHDEIFLARGYGYANLEKGIRHTPETVFAIGSTPIDFTHAAILLLAQEGKLSLDDPISKYFDNVPADKQAITIDHLRTGRSGLQDFHDLPADPEPNHTWIDREEALRRIFAQQLRFSPGSDHAHSHSAWSVLAAVIENASGQTYQDFCRERLYQPAGMNSTGFNGEPIDESRLAIGYGRRSNGAINAPPYWGPTSWLVMGSGGQYSTPMDLYRWVRAINTGVILQPQWAQRLDRGVLEGGTMYGYMVLYGQTGDSFAIVMTNNQNSPQRAERFSLIGNAAVDLLRPVELPRFTFGLMLDIGEERTVITQVVAGSAAERQGILGGDILVTIAGETVGDDAMRQLRPYLLDGGNVRLGIERAGQLLHFDVTPTPRG